MLTDLHVHLRPDDPGTPAERYLTADNAGRYREMATERGIDVLGVSEHVYRFHQALEVWRHPFWVAEAIDDIDAYCSLIREQTSLRLGIEADFIPGREDRLANLLEARDWDYVLGSVHFVGDRAVDMAGAFDVWRFESPERIWRRYFETLAEAARSGLFDILAHADLVKVWGAGRPAPEGDLRRFYDLAMEAIAESGVAIEISTAGLRKPVGELYPAPPFLEMCVDAGCPLALSSDAHLPEHLGHRYGEAVELLRSLGVDQIVAFDRRQATPVALG